MADEKERKINHIAFIMDGNGRWAEQRGLKRLEGHKAGEKTVRKVMDLAEEFGIKYVTFYAFSTENWHRPMDEISGLMSLLGSSIDRNMQELNEKGVRIRILGNIGKIPMRTRGKLKKAVALTSGNTRSELIIALNYGGRAEIVDAAKSIAGKVLAGELKVRNINEKVFAANLYAPDIPDPDLMIRTSGEYRISNFLLWELSYSELWFTDTLWPDFGREDFKQALDTFYSRKRRYGGR
jgi:undecaprenyl diphosphate synthase